jgi:pSer/pThr/pTyr-binding forkhead associated (FHA) protein
VPRARRTKCGRLVVASAVPRLVGVEFLLRRSRTTIGRDDSTNDIFLWHGSISRNHAVVTREPATGRYVIADLRSTNGVRVNGQAYGKVELRAGDYIDLGWVRFRFVAPEELFLFSRDVQVVPMPTRRKRRTPRPNARSATRARPTLSVG